jgi:ribosome biogenesis protein Nip4
MLGSVLGGDPVKDNDSVLIMNRHHEVIGCGIVSGRMIKLYFDIGDFLRRER